MSCPDGGVEDPGYAVLPVSDDVGRGLFATRPFARGETVLSEAPLVSCQHAWNAAYGYAACHLCLAPLEAAEENARRLANDPAVVLPLQAECCQTRRGFHVECEACPARFCSEQCRAEAWDKFHKVLCYGSKIPDPGHPLSRLLEAWRSFHFPPETTTVEMVARILASIVQAEDPGAQTVRFMKFAHGARLQTGDGAVFTHKLLGSEFAPQLEELRLLTAEVFAAHADAVGHLLLPDSFAALFALLGRNAQGLATSPFSAWARAVERAPMPDDQKQKVDKLVDELYNAFDRHVGDFLDNEGTALFELQSSINHSCEPNAEVAYPFNNHRCVVNALKPIQPGEQVLISYLDCCDLERSRHSRRKALRENYLFDCDCHKCARQAAEDDGVTSEEDMDDEDEEEVGEEEEEDENREESGEGT